MWSCRPAFTGRTASSAVHQLSQFGLCVLAVVSLAPCAPRDATGGLPTTNSAPIQATHLAEMALPSMGTFSG